MLGGNIQTTGSQYALLAQLVSSVELETHVTSVQQGHTELIQTQQPAQHAEKIQRQTAIISLAWTVTSGNFPRTGFAKTVLVARREKEAQMATVLTAQQIQQEVRQTTMTVKHVRHGNTLFQETIPVLSVQLINTAELKLNVRIAGPANTEMQILLGSVKHALQEHSEQQTAMTVAKNAQTTQFPTQMEVDASHVEMENLLYQAQRHAPSVELVNREETEQYVKLVQMESTERLTAAMDAKSAQEPQE